MNTPVTEHPTVNARQKSPTRQKQSEPTDAVVEDQVRFVKKYRLPLITIGLLAGVLTVVLMAAGCSKPAAKDPRLQSPTVEVFKVEAAGLN
ncbi:MAG: hypothetical protein U0987_08380, partial [Afipia sp.]|nr:hypothetical protein [Afipia sp.]